MSAPFYKRIWQKPPIAFPLIGIFHVVYLGYLVYDAIADPVEGVILMRPVIVLLYTIFWLFVCDMKKWAAIAYMALTTLILWLRFMPNENGIWNYFTDVLFPADIVFTIISMLYYKKLS